MNEERKTVMLKAGIIPSTVVDELSRWGVDMPQNVEPIGDGQTDKRLLLEDIQEVIESREIIEIRMTDLDAIKYYKDHEQSGRLYYAGIGGTTFIDINYARTLSGHYMIPWTTEAISSLMLSDKTYLKPKGEERVYFSDVQELYYGEKKAFMVCIPAAPEAS